MGKGMTIVCSIAFMISGIMMAIIHAGDQSPGTGYKTAMAQPLTLPQVYFPPVLGKPNDAATLGDLSNDLVRDIARERGVLDTVFITKTDTIKEQVTKVKVKKVPVPSNVMEINVTSSRTDTIQVPVYYLATQVGTKEGPAGECTSVYEVHKVDEICPETINSSTKGAHEYHFTEGD